MVSVLLLPILKPVTASAGRPPTIVQSLNRDDWYPFYYRDAASGRLRGVWIDMLHLLFEKELGWRVRTVRRPWPRAQSEVRSGQTDFLITASTSARRRYALATAAPFFQLRLHLYTYAGHPRIEAIEKIRNVEDVKRLGLTLVSNQGNGWHREHMEERGVKTIYVMGDEQMVRFLALKRADGMVDVAPTMNHLIDRLGLRSRLVETDATFGPIDFYIMVGKKSPFSVKMAEINAALGRLRANGTLARIWEKYN